MVSSRLGWTASVLAVVALFLTAGVAFSDDPFNPASQDTRIGTDGGRAADAVIRYKTPRQPGATPPANITVNVGAPTGNGLK